MAIGDEEVDVYFDIETNGKGTQKEHGHCAIPIRAINARVLHDVEASARERLEL